MSQNILFFRTFSNQHFHFIDFNTTMGLKQPFWVKASRVDNEQSHKNKHFYYDANERSPIQSATAGSYIKSDTTLERKTEECMTLTGAVDTFTAKYDANSAKCSSNMVENTAFSICMTIDTPVTTTITTTTTVLPTTSKPLIWGSVPGKKLPKLPCLPPMKNTDIPPKRSNSLNRNKRAYEGQTERTGNENLVY